MVLLQSDNNSGAMGVSLGGGEKKVGRKWTDLQLVRVGEGQGRGTGVLHTVAAM